MTICKRLLRVKEIQCHKVATTLKAAVRSKWVRIGPIMDKIHVENSRRVNQNRTNKRTRVTAAQWVP